MRPSRRILALLALVTGATAGASVAWAGYEGAAQAERGPRDVGGFVVREEPLSVEVVQRGPVSLVAGVDAGLLPWDGRVVSTKVLRAR